MKSRLIVFFLVAMTFFSQQTLASKGADSADHQALRALRSKVEKAISTADMALLETCLAKDFTLITADQTILTSKEDLVSYWDKKFNKEDSLVTTMKSALSASILTEFSSPDRGFCYGTSKDTYTLKNNRVMAIDSVWSAQLVKEEDEWKIKVAHAGVNFIDNPVLEAKSMSFFKRLMVLFGLSPFPGEVTQ